MSAEREHRKRVADFAAREWNRLVGAVRSWIDEEADRDAEDIVQDVMEGLFARPDVTAPIRDLSAFVRRALRNRVVDGFRSRRAPVSLDAPGDAERAVFLATELEGRTFRKLAAERDTPIGPLLARKHRAVARPRAALADIDRGSSARRASVCGADFGPSMVQRRLRMGEHDWGTGRAGWHGSSLGPSRG